MTFSVEELLLQAPWQHNAVIYSLSWTDAHVLVGNIHPVPGGGPVNATGLTFSAAQAGTLFGHRGGFYHWSALAETRD